VCAWRLYSNRWWTADLCVRLNRIVRIKTLHSVQHEIFYNRTPFVLHFVILGLIDFNWVQAFRSLLEIVSAWREKLRDMPIGLTYHFFLSNGKISRYYYKVVVYPCVGKLWGDSHQLWSRYVHLYLCIEHTHTHTGYISALCVWSRHAAARFTRISQRFGSESIYIFNLFLFLFFFFFQVCYCYSFCSFRTGNTHTHTQDWLVGSTTVYIVAAMRSNMEPRRLVIELLCRQPAHTHTHTRE
jgi:hypothetical protein